MAAVITPAFEGATNGLRPFDLNFNFSAETAYAELPSYTDQSRALYRWFAFIDYVYPFAAGMFFALLWCWMFNKRQVVVFEWLLAHGLLLLPLVYTLTDWSENLGFLIVVFAYPEEFAGIADAAGLLKSIKPRILWLNVALSLIFAGVTVWIWLRGKRGYIGQ